MKIDITKIDNTAFIITLSGKLDIESTPPFEEKMYSLLNETDSTLFFPMPLIKLRIS